MMEQLPYERTMVGVGAVAAMERAVEITTQYAKERKMFGKTLFDLQNTRFKLAECKTEAYIARVFVDHCTQQVIAGTLDTATAAMAKWWLTDKQFHIADECLQLQWGVMATHWNIQSRTSGLIAVCNVFTAVPMR